MSRLKHLLLVLLLVVGVAPAQADPMPRLADGTTDFSKDWKFALVNSADATDPTGAYADAAKPAFDDSKWRRLDVPHDWSIELDPVATGQSGEGFYRAGLGWYRKTFTVPASAKGKRLSLEFDGVYMDSHVYVNGKLAAEHPNGYTGFAVDMTDLVTTGSNVVAVKVVHKSPSSRWYAGSGIYRPVHLVVTDPVRVARHGVFVTTPDLATTYPKGYATVHAETEVKGAGKVTNEVQDATGRVVAKGADLRVDRPILWTTDKPYLYTLVTKVSVDGRVTDTVRTRFGIRWFAFSPDNGFSLNGKAQKLQGVNLHSTLGALGAAVNRDAIVQQLTKMKSMGVNAVRTSHNPPSPEFVAVCEELGLLLMIEAFDSWKTKKRDYDYSRFFDEHSSADIKEMVNAAKNSPSVILWSIGNEIPDGASIEVGVPIAKRLIADIKSIDRTRPVVLGSHHYTSVPADGTAQDQILRLLDGLGVNYNSAKSLDGLHAKYRDKFFFESESSSEVSGRGVYQDPSIQNAAPNYTPGKQASSSYDNTMPGWAFSGEHGLKKDRDRKFLAGQFIWSGQDYIGEPTPYNGIFPVRSSFFGAVDTAGFEKDQFYLFQSQWTAKPMVHLVPMTWTGHEPGAPVEVWAYSNVEKVELFLNGKSLGTRSFDHKKTAYGKAYLETTEQPKDDRSFPSGSYTSPNGGTGRLRLAWSVPFAPGELTAVAYSGGNVVARDTVKTAGEPASVRLKTEPGQSLSYVYAEIVDRDGVVVPDADNQVTFEVSGGRLVGTDNGREEDTENFTSAVRHAYHGKLVAIVTAGATVRAKLGQSVTPPAADASFSGAKDTLPAAMLDGDVNTGWSNLYTKGATPQFAAVSVSHPAEWVTLNVAKEASGLNARFVTGGKLALPKSIEVGYWNGREYVPVTGLKVVWAAESGGLSTITFDKVPTTRVRLKMISPAPGSDQGFFRIGELRAV
ncbi:beta-galactosidase [Amycolatopsis xylanica]|uniref:Beta-galactosidase n=1 Tax=Amycolatopsis xylanica TaxID=589385 RepID=A0A1H3H9U6_9PSEU|nr:glycoside hydrolase family 2 TIM barrel-domain containing protein [Amycolatopsis xylanica]SDY12266.1 beta-galactosidase [Amycolatopsis xylanica]